MTMKGDMPLLTKGDSPNGDITSNEIPGEIVGKDKAKHIAIGTAAIVPAVVGGATISLAILAVISFVVLGALGILYAVLAAVMQF